MKRTIRIFAVILTLALLLSLTAFAADTKKIYTESDLRNMANDLSGSYILMNDIVLSSAWTPIGNSLEPFKGIFDGNGHKISGLYITNLSDNRGLFGYASGAQIKNVCIDAQINIQSKIKAYSYIGIICGNAKNSTFENCSAYGSVFGGDSVGAIAGKSENTAFIGCKNFAEVTADSCAGGIVGRASSPKIEKCINNADVSAQNYSGGICGRIIPVSSASGDASIDSSINFGSISAKTDFSGGIAGSAESASFSYSAPVKISNCINGGSIYSSGDGHIGGICANAVFNENANVLLSTSYNFGFISPGKNSGAICGSYINAQNCYFLDNFDFCSPQSSLNKLSYNQMCLEESFLGFDFSQTWQMGNGEYRYPVLKNVSFDFTKKASLLEITTDPYVTDYFSNDKIDTSGMKLRLKYNDGTIKENISPSECSIGTCDYHLGLNRIEFSLEGVSTYLNIYCFPSIADRNKTIIENKRFIPVYSQQNFEDIAFSPDADYIFMNDIVLDASCSPFEPSFVFTGTIMGNGHSINAQIARTDGYGGIFPSAQNASFFDLTVLGRFEGKDYCGSIVGYAKDCVFQNITNNASVNATGSGEITAAGGIAGCAEASKSFSCSNNKNNGNSYVSSSSPISANAGIFGMFLTQSNASHSFSTLLNNGTITSDASGSENSLSGIIGYVFSVKGTALISLKECATHGDIISIGNGKYVYAGGILGDSYFKNYSSCELSISNSYSLGNISIKNATARACVGGIAGSLQYSGLNISYCLGFAKLNANASSLFGGGIASSFNYSGKISDSYYIPSNFIDTHATSITANKAIEKETYRGFDFTLVWQIKNGALPNLRSIQNYTALTDLAAEISIKGDLVYNQIISAQCSEPFAYISWLRNGNVIAVSDTYRLTKEDIGANLTAVATGIGMYSGSVSTKTFTAKKASQTPPENVNYTAEKTSIRFNNNDALEFSLDGSIWQSDPLFSALKPNTEYIFYVRFKESDVYCASEPICIKASTKSYSSEDISSEKYLFDSGNIYRIDLGTSVNDFLSNIFSPVVCKVYKNGVLLNENDTLSTGCILKFDFGGEADVEFTVCVDYDLDGDGMLTQNDAEMIRDHLINGTEINRYAADVNHDSLISPKDSILFRQKLLN